MNPIFKLYADILKNNIKITNRLNINKRITEIVFDPNYDPDQWVIQYRKLEMHHIRSSYPLEVIFRQVNDDLYEKLPTEWWMLIYEHWPSKFKEKIDLHRPGREFLENVMLLSNFQEK